MTSSAAEQVVVALVFAVFASGCSAAATPTSCDDTVQKSGDLPQAMIDAGLTEAYGSGDLYFVTPRAARWSDLLRARGGPTDGKFAMWVNNAAEPSTTVESQGGSSTMRGTVEKAPTSAGLPGPLPMLVTLPAGGCWRITSTSADSQVSITIDNTV